MKRIYLISLALFIFLIPVVAVSGQTPTEPAPTPQPTADVAAIQALATEVANSAEQAKDAFDQATNFLGIFEAIGLIVAVLSGLITVLAVVGGLVGFRGLNTAQKDLNEARDRFEQEIKEKQDELSKVRQEMEASTEKQRQNAANANLALSLLTLGERQYRSQDFQGALDTYRRALELDPESLITHYRLGYVYTQSGVLEKAEYHLNRALEIEKNFAPALAALGYVSRRIGEKMPEGIERSQILNKAENLLLQGLAISHKLVDDDNESWWGSLGGLYRRRGQIDQAIMAYENAAAITPKSSYAFSNLALLYLQKENKIGRASCRERV